MPLDPVPTERQLGKGETLCLGNELTKCYFFPNNAPQLADTAYSSDFKQKLQIEAAVSRHGSKMGQAARTIRNKSPTVCKKNHGLQTPRMKQEHEAIAIHPTGPTPIDCESKFVSRRFCY